MTPDSDKGLGNVDAPALAQLLLNLLPHPRLTPAPEIAVDTLPRRQIVRQHPPTAARPQHIQDAITSSRRVYLTGRPPLLALGMSASNCGPFSVAQITG